MENETTNFDELHHSDDWPDATTREEGDLAPDELGAMYLAALEAHLAALAQTPEVQAFIRSNQEGAN